MSENRRLAAVMFLDMVGYSRLMSEDQAAAIAGVRELEALVAEHVPASGGRLVKFLGDGTMAEFPTPGAAFGCARAILDRLASRNGAASAVRRLQVRIGLNVGEFVEKDGDLFGDAVNVAARVMALADAGCVAMTRNFHEAIRGQFAPRGAYLPPQTLKNLPGKADVFVTLPENASWLAWSLRRRSRQLAVLAAALAVILAGSWAYRRAHAGPVQVALLYIQTDDAALAPVSKAVEDELASLVAREPGFRWISRAGIIDLFEHEGISDLSEVERLERKACTVARKGGLQYSLTGRLKRLGSSLHLESRVVCTKSLAVVGTFESRGAGAEGLAADQHRQLVAWAKSYDLVPAP
ncbi:MAG: adenylate/guanylate cyclase domain-containing protein [Elusimicrobia bacterium]|nr:adenylate/guanylate cyclase domain-containing protein [Elusimicrobiota bacterium]